MTGGAAISANALTHYLSRSFVRGRAESEVYNVNIEVERIKKSFCGTYGNSQRRTADA